MSPPPCSTSRASACWTPSPAARCSARCSPARTPPDAQFHKADVFGGNIGYYFLRDQRFKACFDPEAVEIVELYDLTTDPFELDNRARDPDLTADREDLLQRLESYLKQWPVVAEANVAPYLDAGETT